MYRIITDYNPSDADNKVVREGIVAFNVGILGERARPFSIFLKDKDGNVHGGVSAWLHSESVYIYVLWVEEALRRKGYGTTLLKAAEEEAKKNNCNFSTLDTFGFQAENFYLKNGYTRLGEIQNYLFEHPRIFLRKKL